jgi:gliding motility-associated-like protein
VQPLSYFIGSQLAENTIFKNLLAASYTVTIMDSENCKKDTTITIGSPDKLSVKLTATKNDCEGLDDGGSVASQVGGGTSPYYYKWSTIPERNSAEIAGLGNGKYMVWVTDAHNCPDSAVAEVEYSNCCKVFVPNAFTPNNDGKNDKIRVLYKGNMTVKLFVIYNRFGQKVFETDQLTEGWDGIYNGVPQDLGTYNYYIKGTCGNSAPEDVEYKGTITLIR